jgi:hypothetical protein
MSANDGAVLAFRQLMNNGANSLRYNIVLVSEGYTEAEIPLFQSHCKGFLRKLFWTAPFDSLRCTFNVFALEVSSTDSGIDDPVACGDDSAGSGAMPATFFDSTMCGGGNVRRVISLDSGLVRNRVAGFLPQWDSILVLVNSALHGGSQGDVAVFTTEPEWEDTALHEFGHVLGLADEYGCYVCDGTDSGRTYTWYDSIIRGFGLPVEPNVTDASTPGLKWGAMVATTTPMPTSPGAVPAGTVGLFESAKYYDFGLYRPEEFCAMRTSSAPFCAVCRAAITQELGPWTPTTTCVEPTATPASLTVDARIRSKVMISPGRGGYEVTLETTTNLPAAPTWTYRLDGGASTALPATRTIQVPINQSPGTYIYDHSAEVRAEVSVGDLDFWVPGTSTFTTAQGTEPIALRQPNNAANVIGNDYGNDANVEGPGYASINVGELPIVAGNGWLYVGTRKYYTRIAARLKLDRGFFGPDDNPTWGLQNISWTPTPSQSAGVTAFYEVTFDPNGLCWLNSDPTTVVDPNVGFPISANGKDAIGQPFSATGWLVPTNVEYRRSISTIQIAKIPEWEWPMQFEIPEKVLDVVHNGVSVKLNESVLQIGRLKVKLQDARM